MQIKMSHHYSHGMDFPGCSTSWVCNRSLAFRIFFPGWNEKTCFYYRLANPMNIIWCAEVSPLLEQERFLQRNVEGSFYDLSSNQKIPTNSFSLLPHTHLKVVIVEMLRFTCWIHWHSNSHHKMFEHFSKRTYQKLDTILQMKFLGNGV